MGIPATKQISMPDHPPVPAERLRSRMMPMEEFIEEKGSGTLRKNSRIGMNTKSHAMVERCAYEFGYAWEVCMERSLTWGEPRSEGDSHPLTEVGWHVERYAAMCLFPGDEVECKYLIREDPDGTRREGIGMILRKTSAPWVPAGYAVFCIIAEYDQILHDFGKAVNPC